MMARTKEQARELRRKERVVAAVDLPGVPAGTAGRVIIVEGFTWIRYWVRFDNGVVRGSINRNKLARPDEWDDLLARRARGEEVVISGSGRADVAAAVDTPAGNGDSGEEAKSVNGVAIPALLLERTKRRLEALGVTR
jgi:hypothetical protein